MLGVRSVVKRCCIAYPNTPTIPCIYFPGTAWLLLHHRIRRTFGAAPSMSAVPQILFPTFIAELERPQDTPKALTVLAGMSGFPFHRPSSYGLPIPIDRGLNSLPFALTQSTNALHRPLFTTTLHQPLFIDHSLLTTLHRPLFTNYSAINPQQDSLADHSSST